MDPLPQRVERLQSVIASRQYDLTVILENVHDPHNIGAVLRTCDSVGIREIYVIYTTDILKEKGLGVGFNSSSGARKWVEINYFEDLDEGMTAVKKKYEKVYGTVIKEDSSNLYDLKLDQSCALLFGNEQRGVSEEASKYIDANFLIPQHGFVQSLNISVACAVSLYEAQRQRIIAGKYDNEYGDRPEDLTLYERYVKQHHAKRMTKADRRVYF